MSTEPQHDTPPDDDGYRFCPRCAGPLVRRRLKRGEPARLVCRRCDFVHYADPKLAAGVVFRYRDRIVLGRRAIEPALGRWTFPGGFVDRGETVPDAARREAWEEMKVRVDVDDLIGVYSYPGGAVVVVVYAGTIARGRPRPGDECTEVGLFAPAEIPWSELAFPSTRDGLRAYLRRYACPRPRGGRQSEESP